MRLDAGVELNLIFGFEFSSLGHIVYMQACDTNLAGLFSCLYIIQDILGDYFTPVCLPVEAPQAAEAWQERTTFTDMLY